MGSGWIYHLLCLEVYVDIPLGPMGLGLYLIKPPPQQVLYLVYIPPEYGLYMYFTLYVHTCI